MAIKDSNETSFFESKLFQKAVLQSVSLLTLNLGLFVGLPILKESKFGSDSAKEGLIIGLIITGIMSVVIFTLNYLDYTKKN